MPSAGPEAQKYAEALVLLGEGAGDLVRVEKDLAAAMDFLERTPEVRRFLRDPRVSGEGKATALGQLLRQDLHSVVIHFLLILQEQGGLSSLPDIAEAFFQRVSVRKMKASGELVTARPLSEGQVAAIERETGRVLGKDVRLRVRVDPTLLGGLSVRVGDFVLDGTVDRQLEQFRAVLLAAE